MWQGTRQWRWIIKASASTKGTWLVHEYIEYDEEKLWFWWPGTFRTIQATFIRISIYVLRHGIFILVQCWGGASRIVTVGVCSCYSGAECVCVCVKCADSALSVILKTKYNCYLNWINKKKQVKILHIQVLCSSFPLLEWSGVLTTHCALPSMTTSGVIFMQMIDTVLLEPIRLWCWH